MERADAGSPIPIGGAGALEGTCPSDQPEPASQPTGRIELDRCSRRGDVASPTFQWIPVCHERSLTWSTCKRPPKSSWSAVRHAAPNHCRGVSALWAWDRILSLEALRLTDLVVDRGVVRCRTTPSLILGPIEGCVRVAQGLVDVFADLRDSHADAHAHR